MRKKYIIYFNARGQRVVWSETRTFLGAKISTWGNSGYLIMGAFFTIEKK